ncbi:MAG: DnaJ domain-containing protein [Cyanobacteria bacterium P01_D01_bin.44]
MQEHYERLGLSAGATPAEIKAAYHAKLKAFPAHSHPQEFKAIRAAYEALRKAPQAADDFFDLKPIEAELDEALLNQLQQRATAAVDVTLEDLIYLTF